MRWRQPEVPPVDWFRVLDDLGRVGYNVSAVAACTGIPRTTLLGYKQGAEPRHADGEAVVGVWSAVVGKGQHELPRIALTDWRR